MALDVDNSDDEPDNAASVVSRLESRSSTPAKPAHNVSLLFTQHTVLFLQSFIQPPRTKQNLFEPDSQFMRRSTVNGRITLPYSCGLYLPRSKSATGQRNEEGHRKLPIVILMCSRNSAAAGCVCPHTRQAEANAYPH